MFKQSSQDVLKSSPITTEDGHHGGLEKRSTAVVPCEEGAEIDHRLRAMAEGKGGAKSEIESYVQGGRQELSQELRAMAEDE